MSWQAYVDTNLVGDESIARAAILGQQGGVWAISEEYELSLPEQNAIIGAFDKLEDVQANGLTLNGRKFFTTTTDEERRSIYLRKGTSGCVIFKTEQAILVAEYEAPAQAPDAVKVVEGLADYLIEQKY
ncbi:profilin [Mycena pura]|uniref:Profilin n=1 Tax=Mycena pura TaxID=153505 RepID=A0AAD6YKK1_9AGAR|nr:profilin [Mycena pura]